MQLRINADDFGLSPGVNFAVLQMFLQKKLHSASLICGCQYFDSAVKIAQENPNLNIGLHFNLTTGFASAKHQPNSLLVNHNNRFKNGFLKLLLLSIFKKKQLQKEVLLELQAQIDLCNYHKIKLTHLDSHRHIHCIPAIFSLVQKKVLEHKINYLRIINENIFHTIKLNYQKSFLFDGAIIKWFILCFLNFFNNTQKFGQVYFFSILYTGKISQQLITKFLKTTKHQNIEIMIHPSNPKIDRNLMLEEKNHLLNNNRYLENLN
jgi:predicted glycoside hydrolase/deacetylase ChbG (UPF0249 family)